MTETKPAPRGVLYVITCGSSSAPLVEGFVTEAQAAGWDVCIIVTPHAIKFVDVSRLAELTGYPVRSEYKRPEEPDVLPRADAIVVFPATFNTINKWALGISDTLAVGLLCEYTGLKMPIIAVPCFLTGGGLDSNPAFLRSVRMLRRYGVHVLYKPEIYPPKNQVPPQAILAELDKICKKEEREKRESLSDLYPQKPGVLYVIVCAAGPAYHVQDFVALAQAAGWDVCVIPTPSAVSFLDVPLLTKLTGHEVRSEYRSPGTSETLPPCDALVVVAATFNTVNKFVLGIADTRALTILCEEFGRGRPALVIPCVNQHHLARHPAFPKSLATLREWGVDILYDTDKYPPRNEVPWEVILDELDKIVNRLHRYRA